MTPPTPAAMRTLAANSIELIAAHQHDAGAFPASPTFPVYRYSWLRDGAFIAEAMSRAGRADSADRFFAWCAGVLNARRGQVLGLIARAEHGEPIDQHEHLPTRYTVDGRETGEDWWDFQLDGYGTWIWALAAHVERHDRALPAGVAGAIELSAQYLCAFWDQPCFDWWEEYGDRVHTSTLGAIHAGLTAAKTLGLAAGCESTIDALGKTIAARGTVDGHLAKTLDDGARVDASLIACCTPFGVVDPTGEVAEGTYEAVLRDLAPDGVHRYLGDTFYGGGRWVVLAGLVGWHEAATGRTDRARQRLEWMCHQQTSDGLLPEQVATHPLAPSYVATWEARWGPIATPLLWSHAMFVILADALDLLGG